MKLREYLETLDKKERVCVQGVIYRSLPKPVNEAKEDSFVAEYLDKEIINVCDDYILWRKCKLIMMVNE